MKTLLLLSVGVLHLVHTCMAQRSYDGERNNGNSVNRSPSWDREPRRGRSGFRGSTNERFYDFARATSNLRREAAKLFPKFDDYVEHDPKVWAELGERHTSVLLTHIDSLTKSVSNEDREEILSNESMLTILKSRKTSGPCVLIGSNVFSANRVNAAMLKEIDFECYEMILGVKNGRRLRSNYEGRGTDVYDNATQGNRDGRDARLFGAFYERRHADTRFPEGAVKRYVESHLQMSHLRSRSSSSHGDNSLQSCGMLGLYSRYMSPKQVGQIGWSCFQSAIEAERRFERGTRRRNGGRRRSDRSGDDNRERLTRKSDGTPGSPQPNDPKGLFDFPREKNYDNGDNNEYDDNYNYENNNGYGDNYEYNNNDTSTPSRTHRLDKKLLRNLPGRLVRDGKEEFVIYLLSRVDFGSLSGQLQAELFKSEETCQRLKASEVFGEYNGRYDNRSRLCATDKNAARKMTPQCFNALSGLDRVSVHHNLRDWPDKLFAAVTHSLDASFMLHATGKQIEAFGTEVRKEDEENSCAHLHPEAIPGKLFQHIKPNCFRSWVVSHEGNLPTLGESVSKLPVTTLAELGGELIAALPTDDLGNFRAEHWTEFMKKDGACSAIPESAAHVLFPSYSNNADEPNDTGSTRRGGKRFIPDAQCMAKLSPHLQEAAVRTVSSAMPADAFSLIDADALSAWSDPIGILNRVRNGSLLANLGSKINQGRPHPCRIINHKLLLTHPTIAQNIRPDCAAAMTDLDSIDDNLLPKMPLAVIAQLPLARIRLARDFVQLHGKDVEVLTLSTNFCSVLDYTSFLAMPISARAGFTSECIVNWKFINNLMVPDMESLPGSAFAAFDAETIQSVQSIAWMTPTQFGSMGSKCPAGKSHPATVIGADTIAVLSIEQIGTITSTHIAAIPGKSFSGLTSLQVSAIPPAALTTITFEHVSAMSDAAFGGFKAAQFARFGEVSRAIPDRNPIKAITKNKLEKLDAEAKTAAKALITADEQSAQSSASSTIHSFTFGYIAFTALSILATLY